MPWKSCTLSATMHFLTSSELSATLYSSYYRTRRKKNNSIIHKFHKLLIKKKKKGTSLLLTLTFFYSMKKPPQNLTELHTEVLLSPSVFRLTSPPPN